MHKLSDIPATVPVDAGSVEKRIGVSSWVSHGNASRMKKLETILSCIDLTTLEGNDTKAKVRELCEKAEQPGGPNSSFPSVAAVCVFSPLVSTARSALHGTKIKVASVVGAFPSGMAPLSVKIEETRYAVSEGADEIDMVISYGAFLEGEFSKVFDEIAATKESCGEARLKVILESGGLGSLENIRKASDIAIYAGADFLKTSTGKIQPAATLPASCVMLDAIQDYYKQYGKCIGFKAAGGISSVDSALSYLNLTEAIVGDKWITPELLRIGASRLLDAMVKSLS